MSDIGIEIDDADVQKALEHFQTRTSQASMRLFLRVFAQPYLRGRINNRFQNEGDSAVGAWAQLQASTQAIRFVRGYGAAHPINRRTGAMQNFLTTSYRVDTQAQGAKLTIPGSLTGEMRKKVTIAQRGGGGKAGTFAPGPNKLAPPRPVLALDELDSRAMSDALLMWIIQGGVGGIE